MKCLHCQVEIHPHEYFTWIEDGKVVGKESGKGTSWGVSSMDCPACSKAMLKLHKYVNGDVVAVTYAYPANASRTSAPNEVPIDLSEDFNESAAVLLISPKASAALSRRCLQALLRQQGFNNKDLAPAIQSALDSKTLPSALADNLDAIRNIGNFAAHPMKDVSSGEIFPVEQHEAEWNLEVLEGLFDFYYVQPAKATARRAALDEKLKAAGKPPMKVPT